MTLRPSSSAACSPPATISEARDPHPVRAVGPASSVTRGRQPGSILRLLVIVGFGRSSIPCVRAVAPRLPFELT